MQSNLTMLNFAAKVDAIAVVVADGRIANWYRARLAFSGPMTVPSWIVRNFSQRRAAAFLTLW